MAEPTYSVTLERMYATLPEFLRLADARNNYALKRYLSVVADVQGSVDLLIARFNYLDPEERNSITFSKPFTTYVQADRPTGAVAIGRTSDMVDPNTADPEWLVWLAQLFGADLNGTNSVLERRGRISGATSWRGGSRGSILAAAQSVMTGSKKVSVFTHVDNDEWKVRLQTYAFETPDPYLLLAVADSIKPSAVTFVLRVLPGITWSDLDAKNITWAEAENYSWEQLGALI